MAVMKILGLLPLMTVAFAMSENTEAENQKIQINQRLKPFSLKVPAQSSITPITALFSGNTFQKILGHLHYSDVRAGALLRLILASKIRLWNISDNFFYFILNSIHALDFKIREKWLPLFFRQPMRRAVYLAFSLDLRGRRDQALAVIENSDEPNSAERERIANILAQKKDDCLDVFFRGILLPGEHLSFFGSYRQLLHGKENDFVFDVRTELKVAKMYFLHIVAPDENKKNSTLKIFHLSLPAEQSRAEYFGKYFNFVTRIVFSGIYDLYSLSSFKDASVHWLLPSIAIFPELAKWHIANLKQISTLNQKLVALMERMCSFVKILHGDVEIPLSNRLYMDVFTWAREFCKISLPEDIKLLMEEIRQDLALEASNRVSNSGYKF